MPHAQLVLVLCALAVPTACILQDSEGARADMLKSPARSERFQHGPRVSKPPPWVLLRQLRGGENENEEDWDVVMAKEAKKQRSNRFNDWRQKRQAKVLINDSFSRQD